MTAKRRPPKRSGRRNPNLLGRLTREVREMATMDYRRTTAGRPAAAAAGARRTVPKTRPYQVVVRDTHKARTREYQVLRKSDAFADLADRAERGELQGEALRAFLNEYGASRRKAR